MEVDAIRDEEKISIIKRFLRQKGLCYELLFVMGINTGLRIGDLLSLTVGNVVDSNGKIARAITLEEKKTKKLKHCPINDSLRKALTDYFACNDSCASSKPLFISQKGGTLSRIQAWRVLKAAGEAAGLQNIGTHSMRKTFGFHAYKKSDSDIGLMQKMFNHSASSITLRYIGIDRDRMDGVYLGLNL
jgi:integrase